MKGARQVFKGSDGLWRARVDGHTMGPYMTQDAAYLGAEAYVARVYGKEAAKAR